MASKDDNAVTRYQKVTRDGALYYEPYGPQRRGLVLWAFLFPACITVLALGTIFSSFVATEPVVEASPPGPPWAPPPPSTPPERTAAK